MHVGEVIEIRVSPLKLEKATLNADMKGFAADKGIFSGTVDIAVTKSLVRKIRAEYPELMVKS